MMKHVEQDHVVMFKRFGKEQQPHFQGFLFFNRELTTKWENVLASSIFRYFFKFNPFLENHETQKWFLKDVMLFVIKDFFATKGNGMCLVAKIGSPAMLSNDELPIQKDFHQGGYSCISEQDLH
jgi:hypothetical protein